MPEGSCYSALNTSKISAMFQITRPVYQWLIQRATRFSPGPIQTATSRSAVTLDAAEMRIRLGASKDGVPGNDQRRASVNRTAQSVLRAVSVALFACAYLYPFVRALRRIGDEGTIVYGAQRVAQGAVPYRDFVEVMGPASFYWLGLFFKLFGVGWWVARAHLMLTGVLISLLVYWLTRRLYQGPGSILPYLLVTILGVALWPASSHHWDSNLFALIAAAAYFKWHESRRTWFLWTAGLAAGVTSCFMPQKGLLLLGALAALVVFSGASFRSGPRRLKDALILVGGYLAVGAAVLWWFFRLGALHDLIYCTAVLPLTSYGSINAMPYAHFATTVAWGSGGAPVLRSLSGFALVAFLIAFLIPILVIAAVPLFTLALTIVCVVTKRIRTRCLSSARLPYYAMGVALCLSEIHRKDFFHLSYGAPLLLILMIYTVKGLLPGTRVRAWISGTLTACLLLFGCTQWMSALGAQFRISTRRGTVYASGDDAALRFLNETIPQGEYVFVYPYYPMYYYLADLRNPTRFSILLHNYNTDSQFDEVLNDLRQKRVKYILWDTMVDGKNLTNWFPQYKQPREEELHLERFLQSHYEQKAIKNGFRILQRRE